MRQIAIIIFFMCFTNSIAAQQISKLSINAAAKAQNVKGAKLTYIVGKVHHRLRAKKQSASPTSPVLTSTPAQTKVYPNPSVDYLVAEFEKAETARFRVSIVDLHGKRVQENWVENSADLDTHSKLRVSTANLAAGIYVLKVCAEKTNQQFVSYKFYKQ